MNKEEYQEYLKSDHWQDVRKSALEIAKNHCALCASTDNLQVHHNNYDNLGKERASDVVVLCDKCHERFHGKGDGAPPGIFESNFEYKWYVEILVVRGEMIRIYPISGKFEKGFGWYRNGNGVWVFWLITSDRLQRDAIKRAHCLFTTVMSYLADSKMEKLALDNFYKFAGTMSADEHGVVLIDTFENLASDIDDCPAPFLTELPPFEKEVN